MEKINISKETIERMINLYNNGNTCKQIGEKYNLSKSTVYRLLKPYGVIKSHIHITPEREQEAINSYEKHQNISNAAKEIHMNDRTMYKILQKHNIHINSMSEIKKRIKIDETYFDNIDSHRKAYYLGLLYADGTVGSKDNSVRISLQERDKEVIYQFKEDLKCDYKIGFIPYNSKNTNWQNQYCLSLTNKRIHDALISHGVVPNKSLTLTFPSDLDEEYYNSFILGYIDGDGSIAKKEKRVSLISTKEFCNSVADIVNKLLKIHCSILYCHQNKETTTRCLQIAGGKQVKKFLDWLYADVEVCIKRKFEIYSIVYCST